MAPTRYPLEDAILFIVQRSALSVVEHGGLRRRYKEEISVCFAP